MTNIAWKNLTRQKARLAISVGGVAFSVLLILILRGLYSGITDQATVYIRSVKADLWVAQAGTPGDFFHSTSLLPAIVQKQVEGVKGVVQADPLVGRPVVFRLGGKDVDLFILGVDPATGTGGPPELVEGAAPKRSGEITVDAVFADNFGVDVGEVLDVRGKKMKVVGIASGGNAVISQFAWTTLSDGRELLAAGDVVNYVLVRTSEDPGVVGRRIVDEIPTAKALTEQEFADKNTADLREGFLPILWVLVVIALAIGVAVIGLTIYTATIEKAREYGVLKAIGFSNRRLITIVFQQSLTAGAAGFLAGTGLSYALSAALRRLIPSFVTTIGPMDIAMAGAAALVMALLSSFIPIRPVARLDPAQVFRA